MAEKIVLSTSLLIAYENMAFEPRKYQKKYKRLMKCLVLPYKTNKKQLVEASRLGLNTAVYERLMPQFQHLIDRDDTLEVLASNTSLKIILTEDKDAQLPYVYYRSSFINNEFTISLQPSETRAELIRYLEMLCSDAHKITICDHYFAEGWIDTQKLFRSVFPRHALDIEYVETPENIHVLKNSVKFNDDFVKSVHHEWRISQSVLYQGVHDRYLKIESQKGIVEVMLSSGFIHIWKNNPKDITCVIKTI
ncbi:TPA: hypothetical protein ACX6RR_003339 [Photobacterium damselae]